MNPSSLRAAVALALAVAPLVAMSSSHREAPFIGGQPRVDATDLYLFRSYEPGREQYVTLIANYIPFQDPQGGPNFYDFDPKALYQIAIDNNGDSRPDIRFQFRFDTSYDKKTATVKAGDKSVQVPLINLGPIDENRTNLVVSQRYTLNVLYDGTVNPVTSTTGAAEFYKPADNIGNKSIPDYAAYAAKFVYEVNIPRCDLPGRVFVGQRKEGFVVNLGEIFDLVNTNPVGPRDAEPNDLSRKNVSSLALEVPISCLTRGDEPVIGAYTTAALRQGRILNPVPRSPDRVTVEGGAWVQVSRLGMPLVNEVVIGTTQKDLFNSSFPRNDGQFLTYVTNPTLPVILNALFGDAAKVPDMPRHDLVATFLTGVKGINQPNKAIPSEMLRLNTAIAPRPVAMQNDLGVLGGDTAGFPNGRRPVDDVVDIELRAAMGALCGVAGNCGTQTTDPNGGRPYTDGTRAAGPSAATAVATGATNAADVYLENFPYLNVPLAGSPNAGG